MLPAGTRVGPYEVVSWLGAGGMGEVYRARDTKLGREVALKTLADELSRQPDRLARLRQEARILASLNHPGIATLHGLEEANGGLPVLVMELVEGETLADRIRRGPLPVREAIALAQQIAQALEAAHERGVLHRDLKPANIRLSQDERVKLLDFGLAKAFREAGVNSHLPTQTSSSGPAVVGTAPYMSPEQARGQDVDRRTDVWAFGCVLFEMLSGKRAFDGATFSDTVAAILDREPEWQALPRSIPPAALRLLHRCLEKDKGRRLRDMGDARLELDLEEPIAHGSDSAGDAPSIAGRPPLWRRRLERLAWALAAAFGLAAVLLAFTVASLRRPLVDVRPVRFQIPAPAKASAVAGVELSPDGSTVAFIATVKGQSAVWLRALDADDARPLPGTEQAGDAVW